MFLNDLNTSNWGGGEIVLFLQGAGLGGASHCKFNEVCSTSVHGIKSIQHF